MAMAIGFTKRIFALLLLAALLLPVQAAGELQLASEAAVLMDADTGQVLYQKNAYQRMYPASITKVMTGMLALQRLEPGQVLTVSQSAVDAVPVTSSHISLKPGEQLTVEQAMYALGMASANDAANVLAEAVSGSMEAFARLMTDTAASLGAQDTRFANANGLPDSGHYTTAYDMALITAAALKEPGLAGYFSTGEYLLPATNLSDARTISNKNRLLPGGQYHYDGVLMAKTGWTTSAQGTFAAAVRRGDSTLIAIALRSPLLEDKYQDTWKLMDYGFSSYARVSFTGEELAQRLELGEYSPVSGQDFSYQLDVWQDPTELCFALGEDAEFLSSGRQIVTVKATVGDVPLPDRKLLVEKEQAVPVAADSGDADARETAAKQEYGPARLILVPVGCVLLLWALHKYRLARRRRLRRDALDARIRHMKRRMGD